MKLRLCIVSATPDLFWDAATHALCRASTKPTLLGFGNGCELLPDYLQGYSDALTMAESMKCEGSPENQGVPYALHRLWQMACAEPDGAPDDVLCYIHDDVRILEQNWDRRVLDAFVRHLDCGLAGFGGATALAGDEIYKVPYEVHQLGRRNFYSNMNGAEAHGVRTTTERAIVFTDGQSMIVRRSLLDKINGWSWWPFHLVHHAYDYGIACMARRHGYKAWLVPCAIEHRGGLTACGPVYQKLAAEHGGDAAVHAASHRFVYDTFRDVLPLRLR